MTMPQLSSRDRRAVLWGAPVLLAGLLWITVLSPHVERVRRLSEQVREERRLLDGEAALLAAAPAYQAAWGEASSRLLAEASRLFGGDLEEARGAVVHYLHTAARESRVLVERVEPEPPLEVAPGIVGLPVRVRGETDYEGLVTLLSLLEDGTRLVRVDELRVQGPTGGLAIAGGYEILAVEMTATGYTLRAPDGEASTGAADAGAAGGTRTPGPAEVEG